MINERQAEFRREYRKRIVGWYDGYSTDHLRTDLRSQPVPPRDMEGIAVTG